MTMINLADTARVEGRLDEARRLATEAVELHRRTLGPKHPQTLLAVTIRATVPRDQGRLAEARTDYEEALGGMRRILSPRTPELQRTMNAYAWMLATASDPGVRDPHRAIELANELIQNSPKVRDVWTTLGVAHYRTGAWNDAIAALEKSEAVRPRAIHRRQRLLPGDGLLAARRKGEGTRMLREDFAVGGDSQSAGRARTGDLSIGGVPLAGHLGPEAALEGRRLIVNQV